MGVWVRGTGTKGEKSSAGGRRRAASSNSPAKEARKSFSDDATQVARAGPRFVPSCARRLSRGALLFADVVSPLLPEAPATASPDRSRRRQPFVRFLSVLRSYGEVTWEWIAGIRGSLHVLPFALTYGLLRALRLDAPWAVRAAPRVVQAAIAAAADCAVVRLAVAVFGNRDPRETLDGGERGSGQRPQASPGEPTDRRGSARSPCTENEISSPRAALWRTLGLQSPTVRWTLACQLLSWFDAYALVRTSSNAAEAALVAWGAALLLLQAEDSNGGSEISSRDQRLDRRGRGAARGDGRPVEPKTGSPVRPESGEDRTSRIASTSGAERTRSLAEPPVALRNASRHLSWIAVAALCVVVRPSSGAFWVFPGALAVLGELRAAQGLRPGSRALAAPRLASRLVSSLALVLLGLGTCGSFLLLGAALDRAAPFPHRWICAPLEFLRFNVLQGGAERYGTAPWGWLLAAGVPGILGSYAIVLPWSWWLLRKEANSKAAGKDVDTHDAEAFDAVAFIHSTSAHAKPSKPSFVPTCAAPLLLAPKALLAALAAWSCVASTLSKHKEHRFLVPSLQLIMPFVGRACEVVWTWKPAVEATEQVSLDPRPRCAEPGMASERNADARALTPIEQRSQNPIASRPRQPPSAPASHAGPLRVATPSAPTPSPSRRRVALLLLLALQPIMAAYFCLVHQGAQVAVLYEIERLRLRLEAGEANTPVLLAAQGKPRSSAPAHFSALFLTPCHATPWQSTLHDAVFDYRFLDCSPPAYAAAVGSANRASRGWFRVPWSGKAEEESAGIAASEPCPLDQSQRGSILHPMQRIENERSWFESAFPSPNEALAELLRANPTALPTAIVAFRNARLDGALDGNGYVLHRSLRNCWIQTEDDYPCKIGLWTKQPAAGEAGVEAKMEAGDVRVSSESEL